jgi:hypothetical protein
MDNEDRQSLLVQGIHMRGRQIPLHLQNPRNPSRYQPDTIRIKIKNVPLSADDGQIDRALAMEGCEIQGIFRDRLRVDGGTLVAQDEILLLCIYLFSTFLV